MKPGTLIEAMAWPVAPRPFPEEALGSWIGRVAARYRVSVEQLCEEGAIELDASGDLGWLQPAPLPSNQLPRLARLARLDPNRLSGIEEPPSWRRDRILAFHCKTCVFLNPADVTAPRWRGRGWIRTLSGAIFTTCSSSQSRRAAFGRPKYRAPAEDGQQAGREAAAKSAKAPTLARTVDVLAPTVMPSTRGQGRAAKHLAEPGCSPPKTK